MIWRATVVATALALGGCAIPTCLNGSLDIRGTCTPVTNSAECVMKPPGERCLDTGTCNVKQECEVPGGPEPAGGTPSTAPATGGQVDSTGGPPPPSR